MRTASELILARRPAAVRQLPPDSRAPQPNLLHSRSRTALVFHKPRAVVVPLEQPALPAGADVATAAGDEDCHCGVGAEVQQPRGLVVKELALRVPGHSQTVSAHCDAG